ncbi:small subunit processome component 20 homolog isoform X1 [Mytilus trossulus]|uniref:small subunit processome component 20 homolog isoform X1 n=2 Tax=Mytilus trossulus TaxID=6551 RepID=UPI003003B8F3
MGKSAHHQTENKFKFQTFSERIAKVDIDVIHRVVHHDDTPEENLTYFGEAIEKWTELNCTKHYADFRKEISNQVQTFAQLVHHKDDIVAGLTKHLQVPNSLALDALLDLTVQLSRDLQRDFIVYFPQFFKLLVGLLVGQDVDLLEQVFTALAYLFKYLWRYLVKDIHQVYGYFSELLSGTHREYIRNFAAESFAFLMRKAKNPSELFDFMFQTLEEHSDRAEGTGRLMFEMIKGVKGQMHSCIETVLPLMLSKLGPVGKNIKKSELPLDLVTRSVSYMFTCVCQYISKEHAVTVWNIVLSCAASTSTSCSHVAQKKQILLTSYLTKILKLADQVVNYKSGILVTDPDKIAKTLIEILNEPSLGEEIDETTIHLVASLLLVSHTTLLVENSVKLISQVMKKKVPCDIVYTFFKALLDLPLFEKNVLPALIAYTESVVKEGKEREKTLHLLTHIVLHKVPLLQNGAELEHYSGYIIDYGKDRTSVVKYLSDMLMDSNTELPRLWSILVCLPHVRPLVNKDQLIKVILKKLDQLCCATNNSTDDQLYFICQIVSCLLKLQLDGEIFDWIPVERIKAQISLYSNNVHILRAADLYFTQAVIDNKEDVLTEDRLLQIYSFLQSNISSPFSQIRQLSLRILTHFDMRLPSVGNSSDQMGVFRICLEAEETSLSVQTYRERQMFLQKLEFTTVQYQIPIGPFTQVPLRYLLGCLFLNFKYLWEPVQKLIATHAQGLNKEDFWNLYLNHLKTYSRPENISKDTDSSLEQDDIEDIFSSHKSTLCVHEDVDYNNFRIQMWKTMQSFAQLCESKSRDVVPLFLQFLQEEYYAVDDIFARSQNLLKDKPVDDDKMEDDDAEEKTDKELKGEKKKSRKHVTSTLLSQLQLLSLFTNPKSLYKEAELRNIYMELLQHKNGEIQRVVYKCIMTYKPQYLVPYRENFERLLDDKSFKNEIVAFSLDAESSVVKEEHREELMPVLMRILYGKMLSKTGKDSSGKSKSNFRRTIVFRFIMGCQSKEICVFLDMVFSSFQSYVSEDPLNLVQNIIADLDLSSVTPMRKMSGCLHSVELVISKLSHRMEDYLDSLLKILLGVLSTSMTCLERRDDMSPTVVSLLKNIRNMGISTITQFFEEFINYKFTEREIEAVFTVAVWPQLSKLTYEGIHQPTPLMKLFNLWSQHSRYYLLLVKLKGDDNTNFPLVNIFKLLNEQEASFDIKQYIVQIVYNLLVSEEDTPPLDVGSCFYGNLKQDTQDEVHLGMKLLVPHVPAILSHIQSTVVGVKLKDKHLTKELEILSRLSEFVTDQSQCSTLVTLLLPFLSEGLFRSQKIENDILKSVRNLLKIVDNKQDFFRSICKLCGHIQSRHGRTLVCSILEVISSGDENLEKIASVVTELNSWDPKRLEEPDYLRRLAGFREINSTIKSMTTLDTRFLHAVLVNCCFFIKMVDDLSLRDNASNCLVVMVKQFSSVEYDQDVYRDIIAQSLVPEIKKGVKNKDENIRHEFILLLSKLVDAFPTNPMFTDLGLLKEKDIEADFFENIRHIQTHRKSRALRKMVKLIQKTPVKKETIVSYLLPITEAFLLDEKYAKVMSVLDVAVEALGALCSLLPWQQYSGHLKFYLAMMYKRLDKNKYFVKIIVVILDAFHFDLRNSEYAEKGVPQPVDTNTEGSPEDDYKVEDIPPDFSENDDTVSPDRVVCSVAMATRIHLAISKAFIPKLQRILTEKIKSDEEHKMAGQSLYPEDTEILRVPLALAMVKLLQNLPQKTLEQSLPGILLKVCNFLKSRAKDIRVTARDTLVKISLSLGPRYFPYILSELRGALRRGYQLHVLGFTLHALLRNMSTVIKPGELDFCRASLQQVFHEELFGMVAEEKNVDAIKGKVFEAKTMKSYDSYQILGKFIGMSSLSGLLQPLKQVLDSTQSLKCTKKIQEALRKISLGLIDNAGMDVEKTMIFVHSLITSQEEKPRIEKKPEGKKSLRPPSCLLLPPKPAYGGGKPKANKKTNIHVLVEFGLEILYLLLKRSKLTHQNPDHLKLIDPFIGIIKNNLQSKHIRVNILCLRCLGWLLKFPLPSMKTSVKKIAQGMFVLLQNYASVGAAKGDNLELVFLLFKTVTVLVRDVQYYDIDQNQLQILLTFCEEDLYDHNRQSTAFSLFKAILSRKLHTEQIELIVQKIREMSITADSAHIRRECRQIVSQYLMDYPQGAAITSHLEYFVTQLSYSIDTGRESALEMLATIFTTFPQVMLVRYSGLFFIPMAAALVNDNSPKCKKLTALAIKSLLQKVDDTTRNDLFLICAKWLSEEKVTLQTLGAQTCGLFVEVETTKFTSRLSTVFPLIQKELEKYGDEDSFEESEELDHLIFSLLNLLTKICQECNVIRDQQFTGQMNIIWGNVKALLTYPHNWIRTTSAQLFGLLFAAWNPEDILKKNTKKPEYLQIDTMKKLEYLSGDFVSQLQSHYLNPELSDQVIKNMVFITKVTKHLPEDNEQRLSIPWLVRKMVREANHEVVSNTTTTFKRNSVFKWLAAISIDMGADMLGSVLHIFLPSIQRETVDSSPNTDPELKKLAIEVMDIIKQIVGIDKFTTVYAEVMKKRSIIKETRKRKQAVTAVTHPEVAARRKLKKNLGKREAKKRKIDEFRVSKKIKRKKLQK